MISILYIDLVLLKPFNPFSTFSANFDKVKVQRSTLKVSAMISSGIGHPNNTEMSKNLDVTIYFTKSYHRYSFADTKIV